MISPVLMGGTVRELRDGQVKVHLHGRLGVLTVPRRLVVEQERLAVANDTIEFARSEFSNADDEVARYRSAARGYYAEHGGTYIMPYDYSAGFDGYCKRHPIPGPLLDLGS